MKHSFFSKDAAFVKWGLIGAIVIVLNLFFVFSIQMVYEEPEWEDFCGDPQVKIIPQTKDECLAVGGQWVDDRFVQKGLPRPERIEPPVIEREVEGYCNPNYTCDREFRGARELYERNFFVALVVLGTATLIGSFLLRPFPVVATALSAGGVLTLIIASVRYWSEMQDYLRVIVLGIALATLILVGVKKFRE